MGTFRQALEEANIRAPFAAIPCSSASGKVKGRNEILELVAQVLPER